MADAPDLTDISKIPGFDSTPSTDPETDKALDEMLKAAEAESEEGGETPAAVIEEKATDKPAEGAPKAGEEKPAEGAPKAGEEKPAEGATKAGEEKPKPDELDAVTLPPHIKPKTGEAFDTVKKIAREKISALKKQAADLATEKKALEDKLKGVADGMTPELKKELDELRDFRKKLDVQSDSEFRTFDERVSTNTETIYTKLSLAGVPKESIDKIKSLGGPGAVDWEPILVKLPSVTRRFIESKLVENEDIAEKKSEAIKAAQKNADEFLKTRATQSETQKKSLQDRAEAQLKRWVGESLGWLKPMAIDAKMTPEKKAEAEAYNKMVAESEDYMKEAIADDSPEMRATLALAGPELIKVKHEFSEHKKTSDAQIMKLTTELKEANGLLEKVKKSSTSRLRDTTAGAAKGAKPLASETAEEALDRMKAEAEAAEAAA